MIRQLRHSLLLAMLTLSLVAATPQPAAADTLFASRSVVRKYWDGFREYWGSALKNQSGITLVVLGTGLVALFIITRVKGNR